MSKKKKGECARAFDLRRGAAYGGNVTKKREKGTDGNEGGGKGPKEEDWSALPLSCAKEGEDRSVRLQIYRKGEGEKGRKDFWRTEVDEEKGGGGGLKEQKKKAHRGRSFKKRRESILFSARGERMLQASYGGGKKRQSVEKGGKNRYFQKEVWLGKLERGLCTVSALNERGGGLRQSRQEERKDVDGRTRV